MSSYAIFDDETGISSSVVLVDRPLPSFHPHLFSPHIWHLTAAGTAAAVSASLFHPLDCLRVRWQVASATNQNIWQFASHIVQREGFVHGLWRPGLAANTTGMALAASVRFGYYEMIRDSIKEATASNTSSKEGEKEYWHMVLAGLVCGAGAYSITTPLHLIKTRIQAERGRVDAVTGVYLTGSRVGEKPVITNLRSGFVHILQQGGIGSRGLFKGVLPLSYRGALFSSGQMMGYDGFKTVAKRNGHKDGVPLHICCSISASFFASLLSSPADMVVAKYMSSSSASRQSLGDCLRSIHQQPGGFWRGWPLNFCRLVPVMLTFSTVYEQLRQQAGLGYFD